MIFLRSLAIILLTITPVAADPLADAQQILNNFSHNNMICAGYYFFVSRCTANRGSSDKPLADQYRTAAETFVKRATETGKVAGVSDKAMLARMDIAIEDMKEQTENNCMNISVLYKAHAHTCKALMEDGPSEIATKLHALGIGDGR